MACKSYPSDANHDVAGMQVCVHKVVSKQHLEVGVHSQRHNLGVEGTRLSYVLSHTLPCTLWYGTVRYPDLDSIHQQYVERLCMAFLWYQT